MIKRVWLRFWRYTVYLFKGIWNVIKSMNTWRGWISLIVVWFTLSGTLLIIIGHILNIPTMYATGYSLWLIWLGPGTPLIPITIALALIIQRWVLWDKSVSIKNIKEQFARVKLKESKDMSKIKITEAKLEKMLVDWATSIKGVALKGATTFDTGFPDRVVYLPDALLHVEVKGTSTRYHLNAKQKIWAGRVIATKEPYYILESVEQLEHLKRNHLLDKEVAHNRVGEYSLNGFNLIMNVHTLTNTYTVHSLKDGVKHRLLEGTIVGSLADTIYRVFVALEEKYPNTNYEDM